MPELAAIPGVRELWGLTCGDPRVRVAVVDGPVDKTHPCFEGAAIEVVETGWLPEGCDEEYRIDHGTWVAGVLLGRHGSVSPGLAPGCTALVVPSLRHEMAERDPLNTVRSIKAAVAAGAHVIVIEQGLPSRSGDVDRLLKAAVRDAEQAGVLLVLPAGNHDTQYGAFPQALPEVLVVGAYDDDGVMYKFSSWGPDYEGHSLVAPGGNISGPEPGGGVVTHKGTSCSAPVVAGVAALLLSVQLREGQPADPLAIREMLLETTRPCTLEEVHGEPESCLGGKLDVAAATLAVLERAGSEGVVPAAREDELDADLPAGPLVYAVGSLHYDFGTKARRDSLAEAMAAASPEPPELPPNPQDQRQMVDYLLERPDEAERLIWTVNVELTPIYAIRPAGELAPDVYGALVGLLADELADEDDPRRITRVGIPGRLDGRTVRLLSRQVVPLIDVEEIRGIHGWPVTALGHAALLPAGVVPASVDDRAAGDGGPGEALRELLARIYYDMRNLGLTSSDRALNFAMTTAFTASDVLVSAVREELALEAIDVDRSEVCRLDSNCWDVSLRFFEPENLRGARRVSRFEVDVSDVVPVPLGPVRTWLTRS
ncbi:MAG: hypothetical protein QOH61_2568 [Chloroflexota bacterium]|nr:hypothetical protein [Chloroflexota bacterium]